MNTSKDRLAIASTSGETDNKLWVSMRDTGDGDYWRVIVLVGDGVPLASNTAPTSSDATININENNQESSAGDRTPSNITYTFSSSDFAFSDTDSGDAITHVKIVSLPTRGDLSYNSSNITTTDYEIAIGDIGNLVYTPDANSETDDSFTFTVSDGTVYSSTPNTITVSINAAPDADDIAGGSVAAGAASSGDVHDAVADSDSDDDDSVLVVTGVAAGNESTNNTIITNDTGVGGDGVDGTYGTLTVAANGTYTYTASATNNIAYNSAATDTFTFTTRDDEGSSGNAGSHAYDVGTITFTVASSISLTNDNDTATEGTAITVTGAQDDVLNDDTADTDGLVVTNISHDNGSESVSSGTTYANGASLAGDYGTLVIGADGSYTFTPNDVLGASETGTDVFTYTADGATATLSIEVTGINDAPTALDNSITTNEDTNHVFSTGEFNFSDDDNSGSLNKIKITSLENNGALQYYNGSTWVDVTENQEITAADITSGYLRFKPDANENGNSYTSFDFQVSDGTAYSSSSSTMTINVTPVNDAPVADDETDDANEDATITVTDGLSDVLHGDTDADGDSLTVTQIAVTDASNSSVAGSSTYNNNGTSKTGTYGTLVIGADGTYTYVADQDAADDLDAGETATDSFTYTVSDGTATDTATLIITVTGINDVPEAADITVTTNEDTAFVFTTSNFGYTDVDDDDALVSVKITTLENAGALQYNNGSAWVDVTENQVITATDIGNNKLRFNPAANENGSPYTTFGFTVNDGEADSASANTITVNVTPVNDAPVSSASSVTTNEDTTYTFAADDFSFTDEEGDTLSSVTVSALSGSDGTFLLNGAAITGSTTVSKADIDAGLLTFVPDANENGSDYNTFTFTVNDGNDDSGSSTMTVNVTPVNDAPTSSDATININENNQESSAGDRTPSNITYTFSSSDFAFSDTDSGDAITHVKIVSLPTRGDLSYNSSNITTTDYEIAIGDIGNLVYTPDANSETDDSFTFTVSDGTVYSSTPNTITVLVNAAPNVTDVTRSGTVAAGTQTSAGDIRRVINSIDVVADSDDDDSVLVVTGVAAGNESTNSTIITDDTGVGSGVAGTYGSLTVTANGTYGLFSIFNK